MIRILTILLLFSVNCFATNWYVSSSTGSDSNPGTFAQPWASLAKISSSFASINAGDSILLKCGDTFYGSIVVGKSGTSGNPIVISSYSTGARPIITGEQVVGGWTHMGGNVWRGNLVGDSTLCLFTINGVITPFARNTQSWLKYTAISASSVSIPHTGSWVDSTIVIKPNEWRQERCIVLTDVANVITFRSWYNKNNGTIAGLEPTKTNYGLFLMNNLSYLRAQNDLYYDYPNQFLYMYSVGIPTNVSTTGVDTLINIGSRQYITVKGLEFKYAGLNGIYAVQTQGLDIDGNKFTYMGGQAFGCYRLYNSILHNNYIDKALQMGHYIRSVSSPYSNISIINDTIKNVGLWYGMGLYNEDGDNCGMAVSALTDLYVAGCVIDSVGDAGMKFGGNDVLIEKNVISNFTLKSADRSAIYTFSDIDGSSITYNRVIKNNFLFNGWGDMLGTPQESSASPTIRSIGVYPDGRNQGDSILNNTIYNIPGGGFSLNIDSQIVVQGNTVVMTDSNTRYQKALGVRIQQLRNYPIRDFVFTNNFVFGALSTQKQLQYTAASQSPASIIANFKAIGTINNNFYNLPTIANYQTEAGTPYGLGNYTHAQYTTTFNFGVSDIAMPNYPLSQCLFLRNPTPSVSVNPLTKAWADVNGKIYSGSVSLQPYTSLFLFPTTVTPIVVTIDSNPVITLPVNSTTISGIATGGTITSYLWRKKTGGAATITSPSNRVTGITGLVAGTYTFTLVATNSLGQTDSSFATVSVNPAPPPANVPPVVTITPNTLQITLPTNTVTLNGSATDSDGTITGYQWMLVSGTGGTITTPTNDTTTITGLTAGTYIYSLTATDNVGATGSATVQVQVNPQAVISSYPKLRIKP